MANALHRNGLMCADESTHVAWFVARIITSRHHQERKAFRNADLAVPCKFTKGRLTRLGIGFQPHELGFMGSGVPLFFTFEVGGDGACEIGIVNDGFLLIM